MASEIMPVAVRTFLKRSRFALVMATSLLLAFAAGGASTNASATPDSFQGLMEAAMRRMHIAMTAPDTGNPDHDFAAMMIPHHQGAIDMAEIQLRFGKDERLRRLAQGIIVEQRQEIVVMQQVLETLPAQPSATDAHSHTHPKGTVR